MTVGRWGFLPIPKQKLHNAIRLQGLLFDGDESVVNITTFSTTTTIFEYLNSYRRVVVESPLHTMEDPS